MTDTVKLTILLFALVIIAACSQPSNTPVAKNDSPKSIQSTTPAPPMSGNNVELEVDEIALGKDLYSTNCMICHKESGKGGKVTIEGKTINPIDLTSEKMRAKSDDKLVKNINDGSPEDGMQAFKGKLTDDEIRSIVQHLRTLQTK